jgi:glycosyltransferase involved in cell wall biosynthesis
MNSSPRFSVCIPNYNHGAFLGAAIESVLAQTCSDFEIVVSDNASTDDSISVVESFASPRVRLVRNPQNLGISANFDRAVEASTGRHVLMLSADDQMLPEALECYASVLDGLGDDAERSLVISAYDVVDRDGTHLYSMYRPLGTYFYETIEPGEAGATDAGDALETSSGLDILAEALRRRLAPAPFVATCYPRVLYDAVGGYRSGFRAWPDTHFVLKLLALDPDVVYVPQRLFSYRVHDTNTSGLTIRTGALLYQIDSYLHVTEFPQTVLDEVGVRRSELVSAYLDRAIVGRADQAVAQGAPGLALRCLLFGFATYPKQMLGKSGAFSAAGRALLGPVGRRLSLRRSAFAPTAGRGR